MTKKDENFDFLVFGTEAIDFDLCTQIMNALNGKSSNQCLFTLCFAVSIMLATINIAEADEEDAICRRSQDMGSFIHDHAHRLFASREDEEVSTILGKISAIKGGLQ